jgi:Flp pilus assembly protein TadG
MKIGVRGVIRMKKMIKKLRCQKGVAAIEFAIVLPLLMIIVFGIIEFGLLMYDKQVITNASREGARIGISDVVVSDAEIEAVVDNYVANNLITFGSTPTSPVTTIVPGGDRTGMGFGADLAVTVTYNYDFLILPGFVAGLTGVQTLVAQTVMKMQ